MLGAGVGEVELSLISKTPDTVEGACLWIRVMVLLLSLVRNFRILFEPGVSSNGLTRSTCCLSLVSSKPLRATQSCCGGGNSDPEHEEDNMLMLRGDEHESRCEGCDVMMMMMMMMMMMLLMVMIMKSEC